jgi:methionyl-tRNA synthetase
MPGSSDKLLDGLGQPADARTFAALGEAGRLKAGTLIPPPAGVFPRYVEPEAEGEAEAPKPKPERKGKAKKA